MDGWEETNKNTFQALDSEKTLGGKSPLQVQETPGTSELWYLLQFQTELCMSDIRRHSLNTSQTYSLHC